MINLKIAGAAAMLAITPMLTTSSADARPGGRGGNGGVAAQSGGGFRGGAAALRGGGANFAARGGANFATQGGANFAAAARTSGASVTSRSFAAAPAVGGSAAVATARPGQFGSGRHWDGRRWIGPGVGFAAGLAAGAALGSPYYAYDGGYYGNGDYDDSYAYYDGSQQPDVSYSEVQPDDGISIAYCQQTYRSYDVTSGTYLGYDGLRHPCP